MEQENNRNTSRNPISEIYLFGCLLRCQHNLEWSGGIQYITMYLQFEKICIDGNIIEKRKLR